MIIFETKKQIIDYMIRTMNAQAYGLNEALEQRFKKEVECIGSIDLNDAMKNKYKHFESEIDPFDWINNDGWNIRLHLRTVHIVTEFGDDDSLFEIFYAYDNNKE